MAFSVSANAPAVAVADAASVALTLGTPTPLVELLEAAVLGAAPASTMSETEVDPAAAPTGPLPLVMALALGETVVPLTLGVVEVFADEVVTLEVGAKPLPEVEDPRALTIVPTSGAPLP